MKTEQPIIDVEATVEVVTTPTTVERGHHQFGPSKMNYLRACAGFTNHGKGSAASDDGQRLHDIMHSIAVSVGVALDEGDKKARFYNTLRMQIEVVQEPVDDQEVWLLEYCAREVDKWLDAGFTFKLLSEIEVKVDHPDGTNLNHGFLDLALFRDETTAVVIDYKFGWIQVPPAENNLQGKNYALGMFQSFFKLEKIASVFIQPKLDLVTEHLHNRTEIFALYMELRDVIRAAMSPQKTLSPGQYCDYCAHSGTCTAVIKNSYRALAKYEPIPFPDTFDGLQITEPRQVALALYVIDRLDKVVSSQDLRQRALALAKANGGKISFALNDQENIVIEAKGRKASRTANSPALIAEALEGVLSASQVLGCCDPSITKLEDVFADALVAKRKDEADNILAVAETFARVASADRAKEIRAEAKARAKDHRVTKAYAKQILEDTLRSEGLLSRPEGIIEFAKLRVEKSGAPQLTNKEAA